MSFCRLYYASSFEGRYWSVFFGTCAASESGHVSGDSLQVILMKRVEPSDARAAKWKTWESACSRLFISVSRNAFASFIFWADWTCMCLSLITNSPDAWQLLVIQTEHGYKWYFCFTRDCAVRTVPASSDGRLHDSQWARRQGLQQVQLLAGRRPTNLKNSYPTG